MVSVEKLQKPISPIDENIFRRFPAGCGIVFDNLLEYIYVAKPSVFPDPYLGRGSSPYVDSLFKCIVGAD
jgi:hypothetical protein